jgi:alkanesulfonate monooxygenase SsuD/methylene tetrahydromethanopterin reductase-like flavin-dependent oxidoreductase (luciferase family)
MKFSLFFEMQLTNPTPAREAAVFRESLEQALLADALGYHCAWAVEHHGLFEYSHCSAPEIFLSFVAAKTRRIRIGHGCTLLPHKYNHPIRVAERIATLDILSGGRINWGTARSKTRVEQEAFEIDVSTIREQWREALEMIPRMWRSESFEYRGRFFNIPPTHIVPKPVQRPHPPIYAACSKLEQAQEVGELGLGALNLAQHSDDRLAECVRAYRKAIAHARPVGEFITSHFACNAAGLVLQNDKKACRYGLRGSRYFLQSMLHYSGQTRPVGPVPSSRGEVAQEDIDHFKSTRNKDGSPLSSVIGDPGCARETIQRFVAAGIDELILVMQTGTTPDDVVKESIKIFGEKVIPHFT